MNVRTARLQGKALKGLVKTRPSGRLVFLRELTLIRTEDFADEGKFSVAQIVGVRYQL